MRRSSSDQQSSRSPSRIAAAAPYCSGFAGHPCSRWIARTHGASPAGRAGCRRRPCSRRGPARSRAAAPATRTRAQRDRVDPSAGSRARRPRGGPSSRRRPATACRRGCWCGRLDQALRVRTERRRAIRPARRTNASSVDSMSSRNRAGPTRRPILRAARSSGERRPVSSAPCLRPRRQRGPHRRPASAGRPVVLVRVLPAEGRGRRSGAVALDPRARAAAADFRLRDVRRRRYDARPDHRDHRAHRPRDHDDADGTPHLRRPHHRGADRILERSPPPACATCSRCAATLRAGPAPVGRHRGRHRLRLRAGRVHPRGLATSPSGWRPSPRATATPRPRRRRGRS